MARLDNVKRITLEKVPADQKQLAGLLANILNYFMEQVVNEMNGRIDYDNLEKELKEIEITVDANGSPIGNTKFSAADGMKGCQVLRADNLTNTSVYATAQPFVNFNPEGGGLYVIRKITGLPANQKFRLLVELTPN